MNVTLQRPYTLGYMYETSAGTGNLAIAIINAVKERLQKQYKNPLKIDVDYDAEKLCTKTFFHLTEAVPKRLKFLYPADKQEDKKILLSLSISSCGDWFFNDINCKIHDSKMSGLVLNQLQQHAKTNGLVVA